MKRIGFKSFLVTMIVCATVVSCSKDNQSEYNNADTTFLPIEDVEVHPLGDVLTFIYTSEYGWDVKAYEIDEGGNSSDEPKWITVDANNNGDGKVTITVQPSLKEDRSARIVFSSSGKDKDSFVITQNKAVLEPGRKGCTFKWLLDDYENIEVESNIQWKVDIVEDGCAIEGKSTHFDEDKYGGDISKGFKKTSTDFLKFRPSANNLSTENTSATLKIIPVKLDDKGDDTLGADVRESLTKTINITQENLIFVISDAGGNKLAENSDYLHGFSALGSENMEKYDTVDWDKKGEVFTKLLKITVEKGYEWKCDVGPTGVLESSKQSPQDTNDNGRTKEVTPFGITWKKQSTVLNEGLANTQEVSFWLVDGEGKEVEGTKQTFTAQQNTYQHKVERIMDNDGEEPNLEEVPTVGAEYSLELNTTGPWSASWKNERDYSVDWNNIDWIKVEPESGNGDETITISVDPSKDSNTWNMGTLVISAPLLDFDSSKQSLSVKQRPFTFEINFEKGDDNLIVNRMDTQEYKIKIVSDGDWTMEVPTKEWFNCYSSDNNVTKVDGAWKGKKNDGKATTISVSAEVYNTIETDPEFDRNVVLTFSSDTHKGKLTKSVTFTQESLRAAIRNKDDNADFVMPSDNAAAYLAEKRPFKVKCTAPWEIEKTGKEDWVWFEDKSGTKITGGNGGDEDVNICFGTNKDKGDRESEELKLNVKVGDDTLPLTLGKVKQDGFKFDVKYDVNAALSLPAWNADPVEVTVDITAGASHDVAEYPLWIGYTVIDNKITFTANDHGALDEPREGTATITSEVTGEKKTVMFKQDKYVFDVKVPDEMSYDELGNTANSYSAEINCTGEWKIEGKPTWITVTNEQGETVDKGTGNAKLCFKAGVHNSPESERTCTMKIKSIVGDKTHEKEFDFKQDKYTWDVTGFDKDTLKYEPLESLSHTMAVLSSGKWSVGLEGVADGFVEVSQTEGEAKKTEPTEFSFTVSPNYTLSPREVLLTLTSEHDNGSGKLKEKLRIMQNPYLFDLSTYAVELEAEKDCKDTVTVDQCTGALKGLEKPAEGAEWLDAEIKENKIILTANAVNEEGEDRTAVVTVITEHEVKRSITVKQLKIKNEEEL